MSFLIRNDELLKKHSKTWDSINKGFDSEPVFDEKYLKTKLKSFEIKSVQIFMMV